jgi:hypothetical protein
VSELVSCDDEEDVEEKDDYEEYTELGKLSEDDEPGSVKSTISKTVQYRIKMFRQNQTKPDELTELG